MFHPSCPLLQPHSIGGYLYIFSSKAYDLDDPLAGLLSDEETTPVKTTPPKKSLSRRLSSDRLKVEPSFTSKDDDKIHGI